MTITPSDRQVATNGYEVHTVEWDGAGDSAGDRRRPIVLVHGLGANTITWEPFGAPLAEKVAATVTTFDLPGFGITRVPPGRRATVQANAELVRTLLADGLGPAWLVGNSMGGLISIMTAARYPELVEGLVLIDPVLPRAAGGGLASLHVMARFTPLIFPPLGRRVMGWRSAKLGPQGLVDSGLEWTTSDPSRCDPEIRRRLIALTTDRMAFPEAAGAYVDAARSLALYAARGLRADLGRIRVPTLLVHGSLDRMVPVTSARAAAAAHPDFTYEELDDCGHAPQLECPERLLDVVVPWLSSHRSSEDQSPEDAGGDAGG